MCLKHQFSSKYFIIFTKVAGCLVPRGVDRICEIRTQFARAIKLFRTTLRENERLFRCRVYLEGNLLRCVRARAHLRALMTRKSCAVGMHNAILKNHLERI